MAGASNEPASKLTVDKTSGVRRSTPDERPTKPVPAPSGLLLMGPATLGAEAIRRRAREVGSLSWREVLNVPDEAGPSAISAAYEELAATWRVSLLPAPLVCVRGDVEIVAAHITNAYRMLTTSEDDDVSFERAHLDDVSSAPTDRLPGGYATLSDSSRPTLRALGASLEDHG